VGALSSGASAFKSTVFQQLLILNAVSEGFIVHKYATQTTGQVSTSRKSERLMAHLEFGTWLPAPNTDLSFIMEILREYHSSVCLHFNTNR
jgi:hypothetical protein